MKTVGIDKNITIADDIKFILETRDGRDCLHTPYQITSVAVYFISREFTDTSISEYQKDFRRKDLLERYEQVKKSLCLKLKDNARVATTSHTTLSGLYVVDGISLSEGDRVLVKSQNDPAENGIYSARSGSWIRSEDASESSQFVSGLYLFVDEGIQNIGSGWSLQAESEVTLGISPLVFVKFSENGSPPSPDENSASLLASLKIQIEQSKFSSNFFYKDAVPVKIFGGHVDPQTGELYPAWLNPEMVPVEVRSKVISDNILFPHEEDGDVVEGKFVLEWNPAGCREGDYFVCWSWMPNLAGDVLSAHLGFSLEGNGSLTASIPTHVTNPTKYETLMDRYLPEMFKTVMSEADISPLVIKGLNDSVAAGFTSVENMANQIIDLLDANATHEQFLPLLSNFFNLRLKSTDPTLWRRQIKKAIPNFKKKGSISGLKEALGDIGMKFLKLTRMWQVVSERTYQEHFDFIGSNVFDLSRTAILPSDSNFKLWRRNKGQGAWSEIDLNTYGSYVQWSQSQVTWAGPALEDGDSIRVLYKTSPVPAGQQSRENYIRNLPLMDDRDERGQEYPPKNWNVHLLEEDDPMFDVIVPVRHPISDPTIWGRIRTEFPYSENAYNMDEYNGSKRESLNPCDIDKEFVDSCGRCQSSKFSLDIEADAFSDESFEEARQITEEYMPFHSVVHAFNISGGLNEFVEPAEEKIETLLAFFGDEYALAGEAQNIFSRNMDRDQMMNVKRDLLADFEIVAEESGTISNQRVCLFPSAPNSESFLSDGDRKGTTQGFEALNVDTSVTDMGAFENSNLLEILGSSTTYGTLSSIDGDRAVMAGTVSEQMIGPTFEYRVSNKISDMVVDIEQADQVILNDPNSDFSILNISTQRDVDAGVATAPVWHLRHASSEYIVRDILPDGTLLLAYESPASTVVGWQLLLDGEIMKSSSSGSLTVLNYGMVSVVSPGAEGLKAGDYLYLNWDSSAEKYKIKSFSNIDGDVFYIEGYQGGSVGGESAKAYRRVLDRKVGRLGYEGIVLVSGSDLEASIPVSNGSGNTSQSVNSEDIKENYLVIIDGKYYSISDISGSELVLNGPHGEWGVSGQNVNFSIYKFEKKVLDVPKREYPPVPGHRFNSVDRSGGVILSGTEADIHFTAMALNSMGGGQGSVDFLSQNESIEFEIEYKE
ncbi:hypothetical protein EBT16_00330 [bacterium]|nr:hypothetical protein [bacterium]